MKKTLRSLVALSILVSSLAFVPTASAISMGDAYDSTTGNGDELCGQGGGFFTVVNYVITGSSGCDGFVVIPNGITGIGNSAFQNTDVTGIILPGSLETIGDDAFFEARNLTEIVIPDSVYSIGSYAFWGIPSLTSVVIGNGVTHIPVAAFEGSSGLTNLVIGNSVTTIDDAAFNGARALTSVRIPNGVIRIRASAFANDLNDPSALSTLVIPDSVEELGNNAFGGADVLTHVSYCGNLLNMADFFVAGLTTLGPSAFTCDTVPGAPTNMIVSIGTTTADISFDAPASNGGQPITKYRVQAEPNNFSREIFQSGGGTISLTGLTPGTSYTFEVFAINVIGQSQAATISAWTAGACMNGETQAGYFTIFNNQVKGSSSDCSGYVVIPSGVTSIWPNAFKNRSGITSVIITDSVTSIGPTAFYNTPNLRSVEIGNGVTSIGELAFGETPSLINLTLGNSVTTIGPSAFANTGLRSVTIPDSVTSIGANAFFFAINMTSLTIGNSVTYIGSGAFQYAQLTSLRIPNSVTTLGSRAFQSLPQDLTTYTYCGTSLSIETLDESGVTAGERTQVCPSNLAVPGAPTIGTAVVNGTTSASVSFTAPISDGGSAILSYTATSTPGSITATITQAGSGTIAITGLSPATAYTFTITAQNLVGASLASTYSNSITTDRAITAPSAPTSVIATATGKRSATVKFGLPVSDGGSVVTSYTVISTPGGFTQTLAQATGGTVTFVTLQPGTDYTFSVTATNAIGRSTATSSNSVKTTAASVASISTLTFTDNGFGTGGKLAWSGKNIDAVLYNGPITSYPGIFSFGTFSSTWNGSINNLTPETEHTISIYAISVDGIGESKSLSFKTGPKKEQAMGLSDWNTWLTSNTYFDGEAARLLGLLNKFDALVTSPHRAFIKVPVSRVSTVTATSLTPKSCSVVSTNAKVDAGLVKALTKDTCTISYTVSGPSKAPATLVKDFVFKKVS